MISARRAQASRVNGRASKGPRTPAGKAISSRNARRHGLNIPLAADPRLAYIDRQNGMFSMLPLTPQQVAVLRERHGIYMAGSGRFNVAGLSDANVDRFAAAVLEAMDG